MSRELDKRGDWIRAREAVAKIEHDLADARAHLEHCRMEYDLAREIETRRRIGRPQEQPAHEPLLGTYTQDMVATAKERTFGLVPREVETADPALRPTPPVSEDTRGRGWS